MTIDAWANFFVAQCGASAALLGLLFVSVSLNLTRILAFPQLPGRAQLAMLLLFAVLLVASLLLVPGQPLVANGIEVLAVGLLTCGAGTALALHGLRRTTPEYRREFIANLIFLELATIPYPIAGVLLLLGNSAALYWLAGGMLLSVVKSVFEAWVLLVEINR